jgi:hypothetical protein
LRARITRASRPAVEADGGSIMVCAGLFIYDALVSPNRLICRAIATSHRALCGQREYRA